MTAAPANALLDTIVRDALDPGYAAAAARRRDRPAGRSRGQSGAHSRLHLANLAGAGALLAAVGLVTGVAIASQHKAVPQVSAARSALAGDAGALQRQVQSLEQTLAARQREVSALQRRHLEETAAGRALEQQTAALSAATAAGPVTGPGITVTLVDRSASAAPLAGSRPSGAGGGSPITDRDVQGVVNALWASGARAITVGGIRLGPQTPIRTAGQTILVGFAPVSSPYVIAAVGGPTLESAARSAPVLRALADGTSTAAATVTISAAKSLHLPPAAAPRIGAARPATAKGTP